MDQTTKARQDLAEWQKDLQENGYGANGDFRHTVAFHLPHLFGSLDQELKSFGKTVLQKVVPLVMENNLPQNLPRISPYDAVGQKKSAIIHHPAYEAAGNLIYASRLMERMAKKGGLTEALTFLFLSAHAGEAGHNCPIACSAGVIRVLQKCGEIPHKEYYLNKLTAPSYTDNFTGAQFVTEIQGGSDAGKNNCIAQKDEKGQWRITGEKWFCSNADADIFLVTARYDPSTEGTKGLGLFLVTAKLESGEANHFEWRRLKDKLGTRTMATAEIDFSGALGVAIDPLEDGFKMLMENVLHLSRLFNTICMTGMARRAFHIARSYAECRQAFDHPIITYPLVQENLARIQAENNALVASIFATLRLQDAFDLETKEDPQQKLLLRLLANLNKYLSALWTVEHIHHCLDVLAGNGTIESFSPIPLLLRDAIICENWEGTHNVLRMQTLRDIHRYQIDEIFMTFMVTELEGVTHPKKEVLEESLKTLTSHLEAFKKADSALQMLQVKAIVDAMAYLFCGLQLLKEAVDQENGGAISKQCCFDLFAFLHLKRPSYGFDRDHLDLVKKLFH